MGNVSGWNATSSPEKYVWTQNMKMNVTEKIDVDNVNMYASVSSNLKHWDKEGVEQPIHLQEQMIFNAAKEGGCHEGGVFWQGGASLSRQLFKNKYSELTSAHPTSARRCDWQYKGDYKAGQE